MLEVTARHPDWWKASRVMEVVKGVDWTEGYMIGEATKLVWNSWVVEHITQLQHQVIWPGLN